MMKVRSSRALVRLSFAAVVICCLPNTAQAIRYELIDGAGGDQGGYSLAGFVEFDSPCGTNCTAANVTDFAFSVIGPSNYSYSYQSPTDVVLTWPGMGGGGGLQEFVNAGPATLSLDYGRGGIFQLINSNAGSPTLTWGRIFDPFYSSVGPAHAGGWEDHPSLFGPVAIGIAIPEPPTIAATFLPGLLLWRKPRI
jgi:hypothetical protein